MGKFSHPKTWPSYLLVIASQLGIAFWNLFELLKVFFKYYRISPHFFIVDLLLTGRYIFVSPFRLAKDTYGETPLTTLDKIAKECRLLSKDVVFDLGCGRGRALFWLRSFIKCEAIGIDNQPIFTTRANFVKSLLNVNNVTFLDDDFTKIDYRKATVIYFYGTSYSDEMIYKMITLFKEVNPGTKIISVSYPLTDFTTEPLFDLKKSFKARYPWGQTEVFLQIKT